MHLRTKLLPIALPIEVYRRLEELGYANDRDAFQQARHLIRQALEPTAAPVADDQRTPEPVCG